MPYHKDKQQAYQAAEQAFVQAQEAKAEIDSSRSDYAWHVNKAKEELEEAEIQIMKALTTASDTQHEQLTKYQEQLEQMKSELEQ